MMQSSEWLPVFPCVQDRQVETRWTSGKPSTSNSRQPLLNRTCNNKLRPANHSMLRLQAPRPSLKRLRSLPSRICSSSFAGVYLPFLFHPVVRVAVILLFPLLFFILLSYGLSHLQLGLDQSTVIPDDSYLQAYFASEAKYLNVGPPVYFVIRTGSTTTNNASSALAHTAQLQRLRVPRPCVLDEWQCGQ